MRETHNSTPSLPCLCANLRRAARALTQFYDRALRPAGLRATQFTVLQFLSLTGEVSQGQLGRALAMDSTTLTRTLAILSRRGWIAKLHGADRRERRLALTPAGQLQLKRAQPQWAKAQSRFRRRIGNRRWGSLMKLASQATLATRQGESR